jgi:A/G-specific adenine glycosylase
MAHFIELIYTWFANHQRDLPWRFTQDPYLIWVSETILQQTRIVQGLPYYYSFIGHFPDVKTLAAAPGDELMKVWEGLGYYSRARNMHVAAQTIVNQYNGKFPDDYDTIRNLKGIGDYTAAAVASIAFDLPYAVVDGNVIRFLARYAGITEAIDTRHGKEMVRETANEFLDVIRPGFHNQAMMEFGALCCIPRRPACGNCPVQAGCFAFQNRMVDKLPLKSRQIVRRIRYFYYYIPESEHFTVIEKRTEKDIWENLYQFPLYESDHELSEQEILSNRVFSELIHDIHGAEVEISPVRFHELTHQQIRACFIRIHLHKITLTNGKQKEINKKEIHKFAFPVLIRNFLEEKHPVRQNKNEKP